MSRALAYLQLLRPQQWVKNGFVLAGLLFGHGWRDPELAAAAAQDELSDVIRARPILGGQTHRQVGGPWPLLDGGDASVDIKAGPGGLNAIQFAIQFLQLRHGMPSPPHKNTTRLLATLRHAGVVEENSMLDLLKGYRFLRRCEHQIRLMNGRSSSRLPTSREALEEVAEALGCRDTQASASGALLFELQSHRDAIEAAWCRILGSS